MQDELDQVKVELQSIYDQWKEASEEVQTLKRMLRETELAAADIRMKNIRLMERVRKLEQSIGQDVIADY